VLKKRLNINREGGRGRKSKREGTNCSMVITSNKFIPLAKMVLIPNSIAL
jgi:hypothetical protein